MMARYIYTEDSPFGAELGTAVDDDLKSWVIFKLLAPEPIGPQVAIGYLKFRPDDARDLAHNIVEAAAAVEVRASLILAMRESKIEEDLIAHVVERVEERRGR